jgi:GTPase SAR1 family protein
MSDIGIIDDIIAGMEQILKRQNLSGEQVHSVTSKLTRIKTRKKDDNLYLGIVGEFSSGKSTLMNALIGADFFSTNAVQGTTTIPTYLKYASGIDLNIRYFNGEVLTYSAHKKKLLKRYQVKKYDSLSQWKKFYISLKDVGGSNVFDEDFLPLFDYLTTNDELSDTISEVTVEYPAETLKNGLVIIDTPGTDSLNAKHIQITEKTIDEKCDLALVIIPSEKPLSMTLIDFLKRNLPSSLHRCQYFITKVELLKNQDERDRVYRNIEQRIKSSLNLTGINLVNAPTLLYLEENRIIERTGLTNEIPNDVKTKLTNDFRKDVVTTVNNLIGIKYAAINEKLLLVINQIVSDLSVEFTRKESELRNDLRILKQLETKPLANYIVEYFKGKDYDKQYHIINHNIKSQCISSAGQLLRHINDEISYARSKDETQAVMRLDSTKSLGESCCKECFDCFVNQLHSLKRIYISGFDEFKTCFTRDFYISAVDFTFELKMKPSWEKKYKPRFSRRQLTTAPIVRVFKKLDTIKAEMKQAVIPCINDAFDKIYDAYSPLIIKANQELERQMNEVKDLFLSKFGKMINRKIAEEKAKEQYLNTLIASLLKDIDYLNGKRNLLSNQTKY